MFTIRDGRLVPIFEDDDPGGGGGAPPAPAPPTPAPAPAPTTGDPEPIMSDEQAREVMAREKRQGAATQRRATAKALGLPEDTTQATLDGVLAAIAFQQAEAEERRTAELSEAERREQAAAQREQQAAAREAAANDRVRASIIREAAIDAGATVGTPEAPGTIGDVVRLMDVDGEFDPDDPDTYRTAAAAAVAQVAERHPTMFGAQPTPPGTPPRTPPTDKPRPGAPPANPGVSKMAAGVEKAKADRQAREGAPVEVRPVSRNPYVN